MINKTRETSLATYHFEQFENTSKSKSHPFCIWKTPVKIVSPNGETCHVPSTVRRQKEKGCPR